MPDSGWARNETKSGGLDRVGRLEKDIYYGNGKPGLTIRMQVVENKIDSLQEWQKDHIEDMKWFKRLMIATIISALAGGGASVVVAIVKAMH